MSALENQKYRADIHIGAESLRLAVDSFGHEGAPSHSELMDRTKIIYRWLRDERKQ